jgi:hypothetical protein
MRKLSLLAAAAFAATVFASSPAQATVVICTSPNCTATDENVLVTAATNVTVVNGTTNNTGVAGTFTSSTDTLNGNANGQADVSANDGLLSQLTYTIDSGWYFTSAVFNLFPLPGNQNNEATSVFIQYWDPILGMQTETVSTNGQNDFGIYGNAGEQFIAIGFAADPSSTGIQDMRQLRLGGVAQVGQVPEPSTWALMLLGFGATGIAIRRSRRRKGTLATQLA